MRQCAAAEFAQPLRLHSGDPGGPTLDMAIDNEGIRLLADRKGTATNAAVIALLMVASVSIPMGLFVAYLPIILARIVVSAITIGLMAEIERRIESGRSITVPYRWLLINSPISGALWAALLWPVMPVLHSDPLATLILIIVMSSGGLITLTFSLVPRVMHAFGIGYFAMLALQAMLFLHEHMLLTALVMAGFALALWVYGRQLHAQSSQSIRVQLENKTLASELGTLNALLNEALTTSQKLSMEDALTGLLNRRAFEGKLGEIRNRTIGAPFETPGAIAMMLLDLDHFKRINDRHGHLLGDAVLSASAETIRNAAGNDALCGRWGGEEFIVALPIATVAYAEKRAEAIREAIERMAGSIDWPDGVSLSTSIGLAWWQPDETLESVLARADLALYRAKHDGRNRVRCSPLTRRKRSASTRAVA